MKGKLKLVFGTMDIRDNNEDFVLTPFLSLHANKLTMINYFGIAITLFYWSASVTLVYVKGGQNLE